MNKETVVKISNSLIKWGFIFLIFLVPLIFTPYNFELFEYNKMMLIYGLTGIIVGAFLVKSIANGKLEIASTPFDIPIILFLISQILSTVFSIDPHTSIWGYYSRFHGGLLSTISYILLYYVFTTEYRNDKKMVYTIIKTGIASSVLVSLYAILQKLGIDKSIWVQDVQNRVFSSLGQPNWLAAYFGIIILTTFALFLKESKKSRYIYFSLSLVFYAVTIFTKSRSGFIGLWAGIIIFLFSLYTVGHKHITTLIESKKDLNLNVIKLIAGFILLSFIWGTTFSFTQTFELPTLVKRLTKTENSKPKQQEDVKEEVIPTGQLIEYGGTDSTTIRKIVWQGALDVFKNNPWFGSGVETFGYSYYQYRPIEHNLTSEWDFLYNKAHNEFLNFAATSGITGLTSYLLIIIWFVVFSVVYIKRESDTILLSAFLGTYAVIAITNFWGFSVVIVGIYFFLIPAFTFILSSSLKNKTRQINLPLNTSSKLGLSQLTSITVIGIIVLCILFSLIQMWRADRAYNLGYQYSKANQFLVSYQELSKAVKLNPNEPVFKEQLAITQSYLALLAYQEDQKEVYEKLQNNSLTLSEELVTKHPNNVNFWKTRTRVLFTLSEVNPALLTTALTSLQKAWELAPNDTKIVYNIGLLYARLRNNEKAIELLQKSSELKPNYYEPHWALALFYEQLGKTDKAKEELNFILTNIRPDDPTSIEKLESL